MSKTREILTRINSVSATKKITQAMKMVSVSKLSKVQEKSDHLAYYVQKLHKIIADVLKKNKSDISNILKVNKADNDSVLLILISSDRGLCSSFNINLFKKLSEYITNHKNKKITILTLGSKGNVFCQKQKYSIIDKYTNVLKYINVETSNEVTNELIKLYNEGIYGKISLIYNIPKGKSSRDIVIEKYLPLDVTQVNSDFYDVNDDDIDINIYEPEKQTILEKIIPKILKIKFYSAIINSLTAEHSARVMAMTKATDNADDIIKDLKLSYNRTRQAIITKELTEIVGGAEALKNK